jgi:hypothetical protein
VVEGRWRWLTAVEESGDVIDGHPAAVRSRSDADGRIPWSPCKFVIFRADPCGI